MKSLSVLNKLDNNYILIFLIILIGFVIIDCNTKIFSKMVEGNSCNSGGAVEKVLAQPSNGGCASNNTKCAREANLVPVSDDTCNRCGRNCRKPQPNPSTAAKVNCNGQVVHDKFDPQGYVEDQELFASATAPLGEVIPKTLQNNYSVIRSFGLTKMNNVVDFLPSNGPEQFLMDKPMDKNEVKPSDPSKGHVASYEAPTDAAPVSKKVHMKMMFAPWCGWSKKARPEFDKFKDDMHGQVVNGVQVHASVVNSEEDKDEMEKHKDKVQGFPTFLVEIYDGGKHLGTEVVDLTERTYDGLVDAVKKITSSL